MDLESDSPGVSIVICAYNVTAYIAEAIDSALAQTFKQIEIIIINDGCPDTANLEEVLAPYLPDRRIRYVKQENRGVAGARNTGLKAAHAPLVVMLDADDRLRGNSVEVLLDMMRNHPETAMAYGNGEFFGGTWLDGHDLMKYFPSRAGLVTYDDLVMRRANTTAGVVYRREPVFEAGLYDESLRKAEDFDLALRLAESGSAIRNTNAIVYDYRVRPESLSHSGEDIRIWRIRVLKKQQENLVLNDGRREMLTAELQYQNAVLALEESKRALVSGNYALARDKLRVVRSGLKSSRFAVISVLLRVAPWPLRQFFLLRERRFQPAEASQRGPS